MKEIPAPILSTPNYGRPFKLYIDAGDFGVGGVTMQEKGDNFPICYFSEKFLSYLKNYSTTEKEILASISVESF